MDQNNTIELKLPVSGKTVVLKKYLTTGQSRTLQRLLLSRGKFNAAEGKFDDIPTEIFLDMQDTAMGFLIVEIRGFDNVTAQSYTKETIDDLPIQDGNMVYEEINKLIEASNLTEEQRKK